MCLIKYNLQIAVATVSEIAIKRVVKTGIVMVRVRGIIVIEMNALR
jgi:hypothetical protein